MRKKNIARIEKAVIVSLLVLAVFFFSFSGYITTFASTSSSTLFEYDCPDCEDGTCTTETTVDCTASGCIDGSVTTNVTSTCSTCSGQSVTTTLTNETCEKCGGVGCYAIYGGFSSSDYTSGTVYVIPDTLLTSGEVDPIVFSELWYMWVFPCELCGGSGAYVSYSSYSGSPYTPISTYIAYPYAIYLGYVEDGTAVSGTGSVTTITTSDCPDCTDGNNYTSLTVNCTTCSGTGEVTTTTISDCETCDGSEIIYIGLSDISTISTVLTTESETMNVSFTYTEVGDVGDLEFIWFINDTPYAVTSTPTLTISGLTSSVYGVTCEIVSSKDFSIENAVSFELRVNPSSESNYIYITQQPSSYTISQGTVISIQLDYDDVSAVSWYLDEQLQDNETLYFDLSTLDVGVHEIYCVYTVDEESTVSDTVVVSIVNEDGFTEEVESAWDNVLAGFFLAIGATLAAAFISWLVLKNK